MVFGKLQRNEGLRTSGYNAAMSMSELGELRRRMILIPRTKDHLRETRCLQRRIVDPNRKVLVSSYVCAVRMELNRGKQDSTRVQQPLFLPTPALSSLWIKFAIVAHTSTFVPLWRFSYSIPQGSSRSLGAGRAPSSESIDITLMMASLDIRDEIQQLREYLGNTTFNQRGRFSCYIVYRGRNTGVFDTWYVSHPYFTWAVLSNGFEGIWHIMQWTGYLAMCTKGFTAVPKLRLRTIIGLRSCNRERQRGLLLLPHALHLLLHPLRDLLQCVPRRLCRRRYSCPRLLPHQVLRLHPPRMRSLLGTAPAQLFQTLWFLGELHTI